MEAKYTSYMSLLAIKLSSICFSLQGKGLKIDLKVFWFFQNWYIIKKINPGLGMIG